MIDTEHSHSDAVYYMWTIATHEEDLKPAEMEQRQKAFFKQFAAQKS